MSEIRFTLLTDGSSDRALIPVITWLLHQKLPNTPIRIDWANLYRLPCPLKGLVDRIKMALDYYPCEVILVHRDAEREPRENRVTEIQAAFREISQQMPHVCVVPVRMQEAWLLIDEMAVRSAAGNPHGMVGLAIPKIKELENIADPKELLHNLFRTASELTGRRRAKFHAPSSVHRLAEIIEDWAPLRNVSAFAAFENELEEVLRLMAPTATTAC